MGNLPMTNRICRSKSGCTNPATNSTLNPAIAFCDEHEHPAWTVIGYNTQDPHLPLFKVNNAWRQSIKDVQDHIASDQAQRFPHIIYTVVKTSDLWW